MMGQKLCEGVKIDPDLIRTILCFFIENQLHAEMKVGCINIVGVLFQAVAGLPHIPDYLAGCDGLADVQIFHIRVIFLQVRVVVIPFLVKTPDSDPPASILIPTDGFDDSSFRGHNGRSGSCRQIMSQMFPAVTIAAGLSKIVCMGIMVSFRKGKKSF